MPLKYFRFHYKVPSFVLLVHEESARLIWFYFIALKYQFHSFLFVLVFYRPIRRYSTDKFKKFYEEIVSVFDVLYVGLIGAIAVIKYTSQLMNFAMQTSSQGAVS